MRNQQCSAGRLFSAPFWFDAFEFCYGARCRIGPHPSSLRHKDMDSLPCIRELSPYVIKDCQVEATAALLWIIQDGGVWYRSRASSRYSGKFCFDEFLKVHSVGLLSSRGLGKLTAFILRCNTAILLIIA